MFHRKHNQANDSQQLPKKKIRSTSNEDKMIPRQQQSPTSFRTYSSAVYYVLSGCSQPLLVTLLKEAGLANSKCQFFMLFYYIMPALSTLPLLLRDRQSSWPTRYSVLKACGIAVWDIFSTTLNYTGASISGPTIFAIIYSSVTIWTAVFSQMLLGRTMNAWQWANVVLVFVGLGITATDSVNMGDNILKGSCYIILGSAMHGLTYVVSEGIMTVGEQKLSVIQNNFIQSSVAGSFFLIWQLFYTLPHFNEFIWNPMQDAGTTIWYALILLGGFGASNIIHSITFFHTLCHFPGGATSAGVMKGLQAVLVFVCTNLLYCNKLGGSEMCFSDTKFISLVTVCGGVLGYGYATRTSKATVGKTPGEKEYENCHETAMLISASA